MLLYILEIEQHKIKKTNILYPEFDITSSYEKKDDGHQFHQYQQHKQSPLHLSSQRRPRHMTLEIQVLALERPKHKVG